MLPCTAHPPLPHSNMRPRKPKSDEEGITPPIRTRFRHQNIEINVSDFVRLTWTGSAGRLHRTDSSGSSILLVRQANSISVYEFDLIIPENRCQRLYAVEKSTQTTHPPKTQAKPHRQYDCKPRTRPAALANRAPVSPAKRRGPNEREASAASTARYPRLVMVMAQSNWRTKRKTRTNQPFQIPIFLPSLSLPSPHPPSPSTCAYPECRAKQQPHSRHHLSTKPIFPAQETARPPNHESGLMPRVLPSAWLQL